MSNLQTPTAKLVAFAPLPTVAQRLAAADPALLPAFAQNEDIDADLWAELLTAKPRPDASVVEDLAGRPLTGAQQQLVVAHEKRQSPLVGMLIANRCQLDQDAVDALVERATKPGKLTEALYDLFELTPEQHRSLAMAAGKMTKLAFLAADAGAAVPAIGLDELVDELVTVDDWVGKGKYRERAALVGAILHRRPEVISALVARFEPGTVPDALRTQLAGCRHLTDPADQRVVGGLVDGRFTVPAGELRYALFALVNNPVCAADVTAEITDAAKAVGDHEVLASIRARAEKGRRTVTDPYDKVEDPQTLAWLVSRACPYVDPYDGRDKPARSWDLAALAANPHLDDVQAERILRGMQSHKVLSDVGDTLFEQVYGGLLARFPDEGYQEWFDSMFAPNAGTDDEPPATVTGTSTGPNRSPDEQALIDAQLAEQVNGRKFHALWDRRTWQTAARLLVDAVGDNAAGWTFVLGAMNDCDETIADFCALANRFCR